MSEAEQTEAARRALVAAARERLRTHLGEEAAALAEGDPAAEVLARLRQQLPKAGR